MRNIASLFTGRDDVHGYYGSIASAKATDRGKRAGSAATRREPVTTELWQLHLDGKQRLGIVPVLKDGTCWWGCIDVDHYKDEGMHEQIAQRIAELGLPLVMTRSKSNGAHLWVFLSEPVDAAKLRVVLEAFRKKLALPDEHIDIFPRQDNAKDIGNWMNMPYFGDACHGCGHDGNSDLDLKEFEQFANERIVHPSDLKFQAKSKHELQHKGSPLPPCIDHMLEEGIGEGGRNDAITQFAIVYKRAYPDDWEERVWEVNDEHCDPPLDRAEMNQIIKSVKFKEFQYLCKKMTFCDKSACKKREFGVGRGENDGLEIDNVEKIDGEQPIYRFTMFGKTFPVTLDQIAMYKLFRKVVLGATNRIIPNMKDAEWEDILAEQLELMEITEAAPDTQMIDRVMQTFRRFAEGATTEGLDIAVTRGIPYYDETNKRIVFRGDDFMQIIDRQLKLDRDRTWVYMRENDTVQMDFTVASKKQKFWCHLVKGDLWFNIHEGEQA